MRPFAESYPRIDARALHRAGLLAPGGSASLAWTNGETVTATVNDAGDALTLFAGETGEATPIDAHPNTKGGVRLWFRCLGCDRRCAILFGHGGHWRCRLCMNVTYRVIYQDAATRAIRRCQTIQAKLRAVDADWQTIPARPRYMHTSTYRRLVAELAAWQRTAHAYCLDGLGRAV